MLIWKMNIIFILEYILIITILTCDGVQPQQNNYSWRMRQYGRKSPSVSNQNRNRYSRQRSPFVPNASQRKIQPALGRVNNIYTPHSGHQNTLPNNINPLINSRRTMPNNVSGMRQRNNIYMREGPRRPNIFSAFGNYPNMPLNHVITRKNHQRVTVNHQALQPPSNGVIGRTRPGIKENTASRFSSISNHRRPYSTPSYIPNKVFVVPHNPTSPQPNISPPAGYKIAYCKIFNATHQLVTFTPIIQEPTHNGVRNAIIAPRGIGNNIQVRSRQRSGNSNLHKLQTKYIMVRTEDYVVCSHEQRTPTPNPMNYHPLPTKDGIPNPMPKYYFSTSIPFLNSHRSFPPSNVKTAMSNKETMQGRRRPGLPYGRPKINHNVLNSRNSNFGKSKKQKNKTFVRGPNQHNVRSNISPIQRSKSRRIISQQMPKYSIDGHFKPVHRRRPTARSNIRKSFNSNRQLVPRYQNPRKSSFNVGSRESQKSPNLNPFSLIKNDATELTSLLGDFLKRLQETSFINQRQNVPTSPSVSTPKMFRQRTKSPKPNKKQVNTRKQSNYPPTRSTFQSTTSRPQRRTSSAMMMSTSLKPSSALTSTARPTERVPPRRPAEMHHHHHPPHRREHHREEERIHIYVPPAFRKDFDQDKIEREKLEEEAFEEEKEIQEEQVEEKKEEEPQESSKNSKRILAPRRRAPPQKPNRQRRRRFSTPNS